MADPMSEARLREIVAWATLGLHVEPREVAQLAEEVRRLREALIWARDNMSHPSHCHQGEPGQPMCPVCAALPEEKP